MPGSHTHLEQQFGQMFNDLRDAAGPHSRSQQLVITDPTGAAGDPAHGHAVAVLGNLYPICGLGTQSAPKFGIASFKTGTWVQI